MPSTANNLWLYRFSLLTALATLALIAVGGLVTSHGVGMAVPDWPNSYGYSMFAFPFSKWVGGIFYEHSHRLIATAVGVLVVAQTRWLGGRAARMPLAIIGLGEVLGGFAVLKWAPEWQGAGHFLSGIGVVVLLAAAVWVRNEPANRPLRQLGWVAFVAVQFQGLLGGLRVVLLKAEIGIFHAALAQLFLVLLCVIALLTSRWWQNIDRPAMSWGLLKRLRALVLVSSLLLFGQLILGATMRHRHAGLAIPDFPLAYGKVWPAMDTGSVELYNQRRLESVSVNPITGFQIGLQMAHRVVAGLLLLAVAFGAWLSRRRLGLNSPVTKLALAWTGLILTQAGLGAATIWSGKAADIATAHVVVGALSLVVAGVMSILVCQSETRAYKKVAGLEPEADPLVHSPFSAHASATGCK